MGTCLPKIVYCQHTQLERTFAVLLGEILGTNMHIQGQKLSIANFTEKNWFEHCHVVIGLVGCAAVRPNRCETPYSDSHLNSHHVHSSSSKGKSN